MVRPWRIQFEDAVYHVSCRGNGRRDIFLSNYDRRDFLELLSRFSQRFEIDIFAFCLMSNHYHLFIRTKRANLSQAMHWLNGTYSVHFLKRRDQSGHFFQGRFKSVVVTDEEHWQVLSFYIHLNPVRAGLVQNPGDYEWSSYRDYVRASSRFDWLCREEMLSQYGATRSSRRQRYRKACLELAGIEDRFWDNIRDAVVIGSKERIGELVERYAPGGNKLEVSEYRRASRPEVDLEKELGRVAEAFGVRKEDLQRKRRNFPARMALYYHLVQHCGIKVTDVAKLLGVSTMAVSMGIRRIKERIAHDPTLGKRVKKLSFK
jgi:putative transposase